MKGENKKIHFHEAPTFSNLLRLEQVRTKVSRGDPEKLNDKGVEKVRYQAWELLLNF